MEFKKCIKPAFSVIGKMASTEDGEGFIGKLWLEANNHFAEIAELAIKENGNIPGTWGLMSDMSGKLMPWEDNFSKGLYLAGAEVKPGSEAPEGWTKWDVPEREYLFCEAAYGERFAEALSEIDKSGYKLAGAVFDHTDFTEGKDYSYFPIEKK